MSTTTDIAEVVPSEIIGQHIQPFHRPVPVALAVAWVEGSAYTSTYQFPQWENYVIPSGSKAQNDDFTAVAATTTERTATLVMVGATNPVSREAEEDSIQGTLSSMEVEMRSALEFRRDSDVLALASSASNTTGTDSDTLDLTAWGAALAAFRALNPVSGQTAAVLHGDQVRDLLAVFRTTTIAMAPTLVDGEALKSSSWPYIGRLEGVEIIGSNAVAASGSGWGGVITQMGRYASGLGLVTAGPVRVEREYSSVSATDHITVSQRYGAAITHQAKLLTLVSRT